MYIFVILSNCKKLVLSNTVAAVACQLYAAGWNVKMYSGSVCRNQIRLFLFRRHWFLYSQHVSSSPAVVHVSLLRSALTVAGAVDYRGKLESTHRQHIVHNTAHSTTFI